MNEISQLCGCPVVVFPNPRWSKKECSLLINWEAGGIGYGLEETDYAMKTIDSEKLRKLHYLQAINFQYQLYNFIKITQES